MGKAATFDPADRLPWLSERAAAPEPAPKRSRGTITIVALAIAAGAAGAAGYTAIQRAMAPDQPQPQVGPVQTVPLPPPIAAQPLPLPLPSEGEALELPAAPLPSTAEPAPKPSAKAPAARPKPRVSASKKTATKTEPASATADISTAKAAGPTYNPKAWSSGVQGRVIQIGAYRTQAQASGQWNRIYYQYPLLRPLPPRVVQTSVRGKTWYRLQLGTFSHAHSEALCHGLKASGEGCMVLRVKRARRG